MKQKRVRETLRSVGLDLRQDAQKRPGGIVSDATWTILLCPVRTFEMN